MQFNVAQLLKEPTGAVRNHALAEEVAELDPELQPLGLLTGNVTLLRTNSGVLATGNLSIAVQVTCNRCLTPIALPLHFEVEETFFPTTEVTTGRTLRPDEFEGEVDDLDDQAVLIDDKHILNLSEVIRQSIWLAMPMYAGCNWTGEGECPNRALLQEGGEIRILSPGEAALGEGETDSRWAALRGLQPPGEVVD